MADTLANRVHVDCSTSGTGNLTVGSAISTAHQSFSGASIPNGATFPYTAYTATQFECGLGTYVSGTPAVARTTPYDGSSATPVNFSTNPRLFIGPLAQTFGPTKQAVPISALGMSPSTTNGAAAGSAEMTTNKNMFVTLDFDATTSESVQFAIGMPSSWNEGTVTFQPIWSHPSTTTNFGVVWELSAVAVSNDDAGDVAFGTGQTSIDTGGTTNDIYVGPESSAITIAGSPAAGDLVMFKIARLTANGSDTMAVDARLHGIKLYMTADLLGGDIST